MSIQYNYIVIEGNIGAGKTSLSRMIAEEYNAKIILERFADNSFLPKFYKDPDKYAFPLHRNYLSLLPLLIILLINPSFLLTRICRMMNTNFIQGFSIL